MLSMNLIFDIDGTMWDTTGVIADAWKAAVAGTGVDSSDITADRLKKEFGKTMDVIFRNIFPDVTDQALLDEFTDRCIAAEDETLGALTYDEADSIIAEGVPATLKELSRNHRLFIVSNCQCGYIELFTGKSRTAELFEDTLCFGDTGTGKGDTILTLMAKNGLDAGDTFYIGDTTGDFEASNYAGIRMVFCEYGFGAVDGAYKNIKSFPELLEIFG